MFEGSNEGVMYKFSYAEILEESGAIKRERERLALDHAIGLLDTAALSDKGASALEAIQYTQKLWGFLISDLSNPHNELPDDLKASLISIGLWVMKEGDDILNERSSNFAGLIEVNRAIRDGLS